MRLAGKQSDGNLISCKKGSATRSHTVKCYIFVKKKKKKKNSAFGYMLETAVAFCKWVS